MSEIPDLDDAARVNLDSTDLQRYFDYKKELEADNTTPEDQHLILTGFIWDCLECYD